MSEGKHASNSFDLDFALQTINGADDANNSAVWKRTDTHVNTVTIIRVRAF